MSDRESEMRNTKERRQEERRQDNRRQKDRRKQEIPVEIDRRKGGDRRNDEE